jgi:hypothetical protein
MFADVPGCSETFARDSRGGSRLNLAIMAESVPVIYSGPRQGPILSIGWRAFSLVISLGCLTVLVVAARLHPDPRGESTHTELGMAQCQFLLHTGIPCPSCGMTTSFAWFVRGNLLASLYVQPMATVLAFAAAVTFWAGLYIGLSGKSPARLVRMIPSRYYVAPLLAWALMAWGWKIWIHLRGIDGWK